MPRRNYRPRRRLFRPVEEDNIPTPSYEVLARQLVKAGKRSPLILDRPQHPTERNTA